MQVDKSSSDTIELNKVRYVDAFKINSKKERIFFPNLDGLRFICFLSVFLFHSFSTDNEAIKNAFLYKLIKDYIAGNGNLGVNFFFVLSGFLITYLLIAEKEIFRKIDIKSFYARRALRIWPLFYFCVFFGFVIFPVIKSFFGQPVAETANWPYYLFFLNNIDYIKNFSDSSVLAILWSIAVEEQFYLVWPLIVYITPAKHYLKVFVAIILASACFRYAVAQDYFVAEYHTFSCISDMTIGGIFATLVRYNQQFKNWVTNLSRFNIGILYVMVLVLVLFRSSIFFINDVTHALEKICISLVFGMVILEQNYSERSFFKMSNFKIVSKLGTYTYGLYCLHMIAILIISVLLKNAGLNKNVYQVIFLEGGLSLLLTITLAYISYTYYESWFLKFKNKFSRITKD